MSHNRLQGRRRRHAHIRKKISGTADVPRLSVFRSGLNIYAQLIDDVEGKTLVASSSRSKALKSGLEGSPVERSKAVGKALAELAKDAKITRCVFDRSGYAYKGRVKALADGAREGGLQF